MGQLEQAPPHTPKQEQVPAPQAQHSLSTCHQLRAATLVTWLPSPAPNPSLSQEALPEVLSRPGFPQTGPQKQPS